MISYLQAISNRLTYGRVVSCQIKIRFNNRELTKEVINQYFKQINAKIEDVEFHTRIEGGIAEYSNLDTLQIPRWINSKTVLDHLSSLAGVLQVDMKTS